MTTSAPRDGHVLVVGSSNLDLVVRVATLPSGGETVMGSDVARYPGGKGANQAVAGARLGGSVTLLAAIGSDDAGHYLSAQAAESGVNVDGLVVLEEHPSGTAFITVDETSENMIVVAPGANAALSPGLVRQREPLFEAADVVSISLEIPFDSAETACELARRHGATAVLNASPLTESTRRLLPQVDVVIVNEHECAEITGQPWGALEDVAAALGGAGIRNAIVTLGSEGSVVFELSGAAPVISTIEPHRVVAVDTTGCGDAFAGALSVGLAEGSSLAEAAGFASKVAAFAATRHGAQSSYPSRTQLEDFLAGR